MESVHPFPRGKKNPTNADKSGIFQVMAGRSRTLASIIVFLKTHCGKKLITSSVSHTKEESHSQSPDMSIFYIYAYPQQQHSPK